MAAVSLKRSIVMKCVPQNHLVIFFVVDLNAFHRLFIHFFFYLESTL